MCHEPHHDGGHDTRTDQGATKAPLGTQGPLGTQNESVHLGGPGPHWKGTTNKGKGKGAKGKGKGKGKHA